MIIGIGTDLCDIRRIEKTIEKFGARFIDRVFTQTEQAYCEPKSARASAYAKRFAAKEAVAKAISAARTGHLGWRDVEVMNDPSGRPVIHLHGSAQARLMGLTPANMSGFVHISLTDDYPYAQAFAICEAIPNDSQHQQGKKIT